MEIFNVSRRQMLAGAASLGAAAVVSQVIPSIAFAEEEALGRGLIGKLEGPEIITDRTLWPTSFKEAPQLTELVQGRKLPPVAERIGSDPLVVKPVHEIGRYGGTWRRGFTGPGDVWNGWRTASGPDNLLFWDYTGQNVVPNIAKSWEFSPDGKTMTLNLREGMRWSDGEPFTSEDIMFWFKHMYGNTSIVKGKSPYLATNGVQGRIEAPDAKTVNFIFNDSNYIIAELLAGSTGLDGHARQGRDGMGLFAPAHYLKQFHPDFTDEKTLTAAAKQAGFDGWNTLFLFKNNWALNPELPVVTPWKTVTPANQPTWELERNPYSIWVDTEGNQLPYIDRISFSLAENLEVLNLRAVGGEYDWQERHVDIAKLPVLLQNQEPNGYKVYLDTADTGADMLIIFNHTYAGDEEISKWMNNVDFRRALSMGFDRDELNEIFWLGMGVSRTISPADDNKYNPGPEYSLKYAQHDVAQANKLLDGIGLDKKDAEGFRLRSDNGQRLTFEIMAYAAQSLPYGQICEVIRRHWNDIGIDIRVNEVERSLGETRGLANEVQMLAFVGDGNDHLFNFPTVLPIQPTAQAPLWRQWWVTNGKAGVEPAPYMKECYSKFSAAFTATDEERTKLAKEIWALLIDNVHLIGVVGLSPAYQGIRVVKTTMRNVPARQYNSPDGKTSAPSRTMTVFFAA